MLSGVTEAWSRANYGPDTFSPFDIVGHLIEGEIKDFIIRARIILEHGEAQPFEPFDRFAQREGTRGKLLAELLDEFATLHAGNLAALEELDLSAEQLALSGMHPTLGRVTLSQLISTWTVHDLNHIAQAAKAMAFQYEANVGVWREYLPILPRQS